MNQSPNTCPESAKRVALPEKVKLKLGQDDRPPRLPRQNGRRQTLEERRERFRDFIRMEENGCHIWRGSTNQWGYGRFRFEGKTHSSHRLAYYFHTGVDPYPMLVLHKCDNPKCVNPEHLFLGTDYTNSQDRQSKGRTARPEGEKHWKSSIDDAQAIEIRKRVVALRDSISAEFSMSKQAAMDIIRGKRWKHIKTEQNLAAVVEALK